MDKRVVDQLHLTPRSSEELHEMLNHFESKWQQKAGKLGIHSDTARL